MEIAQRHQDRLGEIKDTVKSAYEYMHPNYKTFNEYQTFVFDTSLTQDDITLLTTLSKPQIEFNICEAFISKQLGEFYKQEPSIEVSSNSERHADPLMIDAIEQHIRYLLLDTKNTHTLYEVFKDLLSGGFSAFKIWTEYKNQKSFSQEIRLGRVSDPTLCGWDPLARLSHKGDGRFCFELSPYDEKTFRADYPHIDIDKIDFSGDFSSFKWAYLNNDKKIVLVCDFYEKKKRDVKIVQLVDGKVMTDKEYKLLLDEWNDITQPPAIKGKPRWTQMETICRYRCIQNQVIEYKETDFCYLPLVFVDGNSIFLKSPENGTTVHQKTRPYVYHVKGAQKLKNFAGITLANEIENIIQHKIMIAKEALPKEEDWLEAYKDIQKPSTFVYNAFFEQDVDKPIPNPIREVNRIPTPPEVMQAFASTDSLVQTILGSYDASLGINNNNLSGKAIVEGAGQSNAAAMPYRVGFIQGLNRVAEIFLDLIPKYYKTPRTIPLKGKDGKTQFIMINQDGGISLDYDVEDLNIKVEAGASFELQKSNAMQQLTMLMKISPTLDQFMNEEGLPILLDNLDIRGVDQLKDRVDVWLQKQAQQKQMMQQQQQQAMANSPIAMKNQIELQKLQQTAQKNQADFHLDMNKLQLDQQKLLADAQIAQSSHGVQLIKAQTEKFAKSVDLALKHKDTHHRHAQDVINLTHKMTSDEKNQSS